MALQKYRNKIPPSRQDELESTLKHFLRKGVISEEDIATAAGIDPKNASFYEEKGYAVL
jgi:hypothetical protein